LEPAEPLAGFRSHLEPVLPDLSLLPEPAVGAPASADCLPHRHGPAGVFEVVLRLVCRPGETLCDPLRRVGRDFLLPSLGLLCLNGLHHLRYDRGGAKEGHIGRSMSDADFRKTKNEDYLSNWNRVLTFPFLPHRYPATI
jgi:hypothetical protein